MSDFKDFEDGIIEDVYYTRGINRVSGEQRLKKAPFQLLTWRNGDGTSESLVMPSLISSDGEQAFGSDGGSIVDMGYDDFGYHTGKFHIIEESSMGDYEGHPNDWIGMHSFGNL